MTPINWQQRARETNLSVRNFIGGKYLEGEGETTITKQSPRDGKLLYAFQSDDGTSVDKAVAVARQSFEDGSWREMPFEKRKAALWKLAELIEANKEEFALYECLDVGKPISKALNIDIPLVVSSLKQSAEGADKLLSAAIADGGRFAYQHRKPVGVVGGIFGWNYPMTLAASTLGPALAMGNSLVIKPSEFTSLSTGRLAELALEAGVPEGVFNVIHGKGSTTGAALARHRDIDLLSFVGSSATGKQMMIAAGESNMKRLLLECGGKSPYLVFEDCLDFLDSVAENIVSKAFANQGALCVAATRVLIHESIKDKLLPIILEKTAQIAPQDPLNPATTFGAIINQSHLEKILSYIETGKQQGANAVFEGRQIELQGAASISEGGVFNGYYLQPTVFDNVNPEHQIAREEIFGPVLCVFTFQNEDEAIALANNSRYGLAAYAATESMALVQKLGQNLSVGSLEILNASRLAAARSGSDIEIENVPIEPHKQSGFGYIGGLEGLSAYSNSTTLYI